MDNKAIQEQRMKSYFIEAAKKILRGEGFKSISVRNIANEAGYSYATLYNYFKDLREVLYFCVLDFLEECRTFTVSQNRSKMNADEHLRSVTKAYCNFFVQYPSFFELIFTERIYEITSQDKIALANEKLYDDLFSPAWAKFEKSGLDKESVNAKKLLHKHVIHSILMFYLLRRIPKTYQEFIKEMDASMDALLAKQ